MSGPKTLSYQLSDEVLLKMRRAARQQRQTNNLASKMLQGQISRAEQQVYALAEEIRSYHAICPDLVCKFNASPTGTSQDGISTSNDHLATLNKTIVHLQEVLKEIRSGARAKNTLKSKADPNMPSIRSSSEALQVAPTDKFNIEFAACNSIRDGINAAIGSFLSKECAPFPKDMSALVSCLPQIIDPTKMTDIALQIRHGLAAESDRLKKEREQEKKNAESLMSQLIPVVAELDQLKAATNEAQGGDSDLLDFCASVEKLDYALREVILGQCRLDTVLRDSHAAILTEMADLKRTRTEAAAGILYNAFTNLGYQVEPIANTLMVQGESVYLRHNDWPNDYYVRLLMEQEQATINFNVVRAVDSQPGQVGQHKDLQQTQLDLAMENQWCSQLPNIQEHIKSHGITTKYVRKINAGACQVQEVQLNKIPEALRPAAVENNNGIAQNKLYAN